MKSQTMESQGTQISSDFQRCSYILFHSCAPFYCSQNIFGIMTKNCPQPLIFAITKAHPIVLLVIIETIEIVFLFF